MIEYIDLRLMVCWSKILEDYEPLFIKTHQDILTEKLQTIKYVLVSSSYQDKILMDFIGNQIKLFELLVKKMFLDYRLKKISI